MTATPAPLEIPGPVLNEVYAEARLAFPFECCGWLAGDTDGSSVTVVRKCINAQTSGTHPVKPERSAESAYLFTAKDAIDLDRSFDSTRPARIIYHSHPNGEAYFSETDLSVAMGPWPDEGPAYPVQQLVVGIDAQRVVEAALFAWSDQANGFVEIARYAGAEV